MKKGLVYSLMAAVLGVLVVVVPLFLMPIADMEHYGTEFEPLALSERMRNLETLYGLGKASTQGYFAGLSIFIIGFAAAVVVYLLVKARFSS
ncbi:MAG: hypothetical protein QHH12_04600 [Candidatus Bathyarchaeota archaeon]|nr:hypothetical protein [Candidatus Bathyarchaeota archaeon A05DMB-3]MDH7607032.1 hypothetical protein [Candidatus Bathyarchaeota archaeon]